MNKLKGTNFEVGQIWISIKRKKYRILSIDSSPEAWYPLLLEDCETKFLITATETGELYDMFQSAEDKLIAQVSEDFSLSARDKDIADRVLRVYNKREEIIKKNKDANNRNVLLSLGKTPKKDKE